MKERLKETKIGIVGGAGPMAGLVLHRAIIDYCQERYGSFEDYEFPQIVHLSIPWGQMLRKNISQGNEPKVGDQLHDALEILTNLDSNKVVIACNTLHFYLNEDNIYSKPRLTANLINLPRTAEQEIAKIHPKEKVLLLGTTITNSKLYQRDNIITIKDEEQVIVDEVIYDVLKGNFSSASTSKMADLIMPYLDQTDKVILGCTEFSVLESFSPLKEYMRDNKSVSITTYDPIKILLPKLLA